MALVLALAPSAAAAETVIVAFGDSLTAGYRLPPTQAFPARLESALRERGHEVRVLNAGVSGDTTAAGLARLDWAVPPEADAVIVQLGGNDALRGIDPAETRRALAAILDRLAARGLPVLLAGMLSPPNMGPEYVAAFDAVFGELAAGRDVVFYPFFLDGVAAERDLNLSDGIHPNAEGVARIVERILPMVEELISRAKAAPRG